MSDERESGAVRAKAPKCEWDTHGCVADAIAMNYYKYNDTQGAQSDPVCAEHQWTASRCHADEYDRYDPILLATVGDELWCALEAAFHTFTEARGKVLDDVNARDNAEARRRRMGAAA